MNSRFIAVIVLVGLTINACDQLPTAQRNKGVAVLDLNAVAKATERDQAINQSMESARVDLNAQLTQIAGDLEKQLKDQQDKAGPSPQPVEQQQLQNMAAEAQRQLAEKQQLAQQKAQQLQLELVSEFKRQVQPVAEQIAKSQGAEIVVILDDAILWFDSVVDITDEVIAELRANPLPPIQVTAGVVPDNSNEAAAAESDD